MIAASAPMMEALSKLQTQLYVGYMIAMNPSPALRERVEEWHQRVRFLNDWLFIELVQATCDQNATIDELTAKFRAEEAAREAALKGMQASHASVFSHTN